MIFGINIGKMDYIPFKIFKSVTLKQKLSYLFQVKLWSAPNKHTHTQFLSNPGSRDKGRNNRTGKTARIEAWCNATEVELTSTVRFL